MPKPETIPALEQEIAALKNRRYDVTYELKLIDEQLEQLQTELFDKKVWEISQGKLAIDAELLPTEQFVSELLRRNWSGRDINRWRNSILAIRKINVEHEYVELHIVNGSSVVGSIPFDLALNMRKAYLQSDEKVESHA